MNIPIPSIPEYFINKNGEIFSSYTGKLLTPYMVSGYIAFKLQVNGAQKSCLLHRLLAHTYLDLYDLWDSNLEVDHKDRDKLNNCIDNLQVLTVAEHSIKTKKDNNWGSSKNTCPNCGRLKLQNSKTCIGCTPLPTGKMVKPEITLSDIENNVKRMGWMQASKILGVSESTLRRRYTKLSGNHPSVLTLQKNKPTGEGNCLESS